VNNQKTVIHGKKSRPLKAPYPKHDRIKRRKEVYRLYFDLGYSGVEIADFMNKDKKTIYADINHILNTIHKEQNEFDYSAWFVKQLTRLEKQRGQLFRLLEKNKDDFNNTMSIQKMILDVDSKISSLVLRDKDVRDDHTKIMIRLFNEAVDKYNKDEDKKSKFSDRMANNYNQGYKDGKFKMIFE